MGPDPEPLRVRRGPISTVTLEDPFSLTISEREAESGHTLMLRPGTNTLIGLF
jgi:hypothetical protein